MKQTTIKKSLLCPLLLITLFLSSCNLINVDSNSTLTSENSSSEGTSENSSSEKTSENSNSSEGKEDNSSENTSQSSEDSVYVPSSYPFTLKDANNSMGYYSLNPIGEQNILVIPVQLSQAPSWTTSMLERLEIAFFGTSEETNYFESVKSFYERASYNKFSLKGEIAPVFKSSYTTSQIKRGSESTIEDGLIEEFYRSADSDLLKRHDLDNDGRVDATMFIYSNNYDGNNFWAWVWYLNADNTSTSKPTIGTYMWASYNFMNDGLTSSEINTKVDAHTYIHEFGHVLGLDDYYCYDDDGWDPVGESEMQSYNIGDQSIYSKLQLGWANPQVVKPTTTVTDITLKTSALYNDGILINDNWNNSPMDEYILIEYYTPKGNNLVDSLTSYDSRVKMYTTPGLRIYHADARLVRLVNADGTSSTYSDTIKSDAIYFPGASNSTSWSYLKSPYNSSYRLVQLMQANVTSSSSSNHFKNRGRNSNDTLYGLNQTFKASSIFFTNGIKFNDGTEVGYSVTMIAQNGDECTVRIQKL